MVTALWLHKESACHGKQISSIADTGVVLTHSQLGNSEVQIYGLLKAYGGLPLDNTNKRGWDSTISILISIFQLVAFRLVILRTV